MGFLITQLLFCLLLAAAIGLVVGWLTRRFICQKQAQALEAGWSARLSRLETQRDEFAARVAQLSQFTASNVAWVDEHLRFKGRIQREGWVEQAVGLAAGRPTEFSRRYLSKSR